MERYERIKEVLDNMSVGQLVNVHNMYCEAVNYPDDIIYSMYDFDEIMCGIKPSQLASLLCGGRYFSIKGDYFYFNGYGFLESFSYIGDSNIYTCDIARYIDDSEDCLNIDYIQEILEGGEDCLNIDDIQEILEGE